MSAADDFQRALDADDTRQLLSAIHAGADPGAKGPDGDWLRGKDDYTALHVAARGTAELCRRVLDAGIPADVTDDQGRIPLHYVWETEVFEMLLDADSDPNTKDKWGCNTLWYQSSARDSYTVVKRLLELGVDPTPLHEHGSRSWFGFLYDSEVEGLRAFAEAGVDMNPPETYGKRTALHRAAWGDEVECIKVLIGAGVDLLAKNDEGQTAADVARSENHPGIVALLAEAGGDPRADEVKLPAGIPDPQTVEWGVLLEGVATKPVGDATRDSLRAMGPIGESLDAALDSNDLEPFYAALETWFDDAHSEVAKGFKEYAEATLQMGTIGERDDTGEHGGPFELWGVAEALTNRASFADVTGLKIFGERPFPGFMVGRRDEAEIWVLAGHLHYGKRNAFTIVMTRDELRAAAKQCARDGDYYSLTGGDYNPLPDYMELLYFMIAPMDLAQVFFLQRYAMDNSAETLMQAVFGWDDKRLKDARRRANALAHIDAAIGQ